MGRLKIALLVPDGAADSPLEALEGGTPLEVAVTPGMDRVAASGVAGTAVTVPPGMPPGSDVANLSLLGYDPSASLRGRGPIEAANLGIEMPEGWTAFRFNLVSTDGERMLDYSAGHIAQREAVEIVGELESALGDERTRFFPGKSYRHILLLEGRYDELKCFPPHDITGEPVAGRMPEGRGSERVRQLMVKSRDVLSGAHANARLEASGRPRADIIWPWGQGEAMALEPFRSRFGLEGGVISAVDLVCGLGRLAGLRVVEVPGITGYLDTNYAGKGEAAVRVLTGEDFVFVHVEAPDEASHIRSVEEKVTAIERFDAMVVRPVLEWLEGHRPFRLLVCPDHRTLISTGTHDAGPIPYAVCGEGIHSSGSKAFSEAVAEEGGPHFERGCEMMPCLASGAAWRPRP